MAKYQVTFGCVVEVEAEDKYVAEKKAWDMLRGDDLTPAEYLDGPDAIIITELDENGDPVDL